MMVITITIAAITITADQISEFNFDTEGLEITSALTIIKNETNKRLRSSRSYYKLRTSHLLATSVHVPKIKISL